MILRSVELESFGRFKGETIEFRRGMNLVIGPNEAGKSTLAEAVPAVLFGTNRLEKFKTWGRNTCSAALFFEGGRRTIQIRRNLITDEVELVEKDDLYHVLSQFSGKVPLRGRSASCREYHALLEKLLGVGDDKLFRATYFFGHHPQEWSGDELSRNLRTLVSGTAEADYAEILDALLDEHFSLTSSNPWGRDKQRDREYEQVCQQLENAGGVEAVPVFVELDTTAEISAQIETLSAELIKDRLEYEKGQHYIERVRSQSEGSAAADPAPSVTSAPEPPAGTGGRDLVGQLTAVGLPENPPPELPELLAEAANIRQALAELQQPYSQLHSQEKQLPVVPWALSAAALFLGAAGVAVAWWLSFYLLWIAVGVGGLAIALLGWTGWKYISRKNGLTECKKQRSRLDQMKLSAQSRQAALSERCEALGLPSSPIDLVRLQKLVTAHRELLDRFWAGASAVLPSDPEPDIVASEPSQEIALPLEDDQTQELQELEARMAEFEKGLQEKEARLAKLKQQLDDNANTPQPPQSTPNVSALQKRKLALESRIAVLRQSISLLAGAVEEFGCSHLVRLNEEAGKMFGKITAGRYNELKLDENMVPLVKIDGRRWMSVDNFSRGTVDAIYLALRVALAKVRDDGRSLPLMLDDPFVHLDQKRLAKAMNMVDLASAESQLILFSHNMELGKRAARERWHVVPLDGDATQRSSEEEGGEHAGQLHLL